jgi:hypothetical protein
VSPDEVRYRAALDLAERGFVVYQRVIGGAGNGAPALLAIDRRKGGGGVPLKVAAMAAIERSGRVYCNRARIGDADLVVLVRSDGECRLVKAGALRGDLAAESGDAAESPLDAQNGVLRPRPAANGAI